MKKLLTVIFVAVILSLPAMMTAYSITSSASLLQNEYKKQIETRLENELRAQSQISLISQELLKHFSFFLIQTEQFYESITWKVFSGLAGREFEKFITATMFEYMLPMQISVIYNLGQQKQQINFDGPGAVERNGLTDLSLQMRKFISMAFFNNPPEGEIEALQQLIKECRLIFNLDFLKSAGDRAKINQMVIRSPESTKMLLTLRSKSDYLMNVLVDLSRAGIRAAANKAARTWKDRDSGIIFFGGREKIRPIFSTWFDKFPDLGKKAIREINMARHGVSRLEMAPYLVLFTPFDPKVPCQVAIVAPIPQKPSQPGLKILLCIFSIIGCAIWKLAVDHILFGRTIRLSLRNFIILIFTLASMMPFTSGLYLTNEYVISNFKVQKNMAAENLSSELEDLDLNTYSNFRSSINQVRGMNSIEAIASFTGLSLETPHPEMLKAMLTKMIKESGAERFSEVWISSNETKLIEVELQNDLKTFHIKPTEDAFTNEVFAPRFRHILNEKTAGSISKSSSGDEIEFDAVKAEILDNIMLNLFGEQTYFNLQEDIGTLLKLESFFDSNALLSLPITMNGQLKYIFSYIFSSLSLRRHFPAHRLNADPRKPVFTTLYGNDEYLNAYPGSLHELSRNFPTLIELARQSLLTGSRFSLQDVNASGSPIFETLPARYSDFILCGQRNTRSLGSISQELTATAIKYFMIMFVIALLLALLSSLYFTIPIRQLTEATQKIIAEDYSVRISERHPDEFAAAAIAFNKMAGGLAEGKLLKNFVSESVRESSTADNSDEQAKIIEATVLFSSIKGFSAIQGQLAPSELFALMQSHLSAAVSMVSQHGGEIDKMIEDKVMVVFPHQTGKSQESVASAALACARHIQQQLWQVHKLPVAIGINSGEVVSGVMGAANVRLARTVVGDTVNLAARLATVASGLNQGGVVVSGATAKLATGHCRFERLPINSVKGKTHAVEALLADFSQNSEGA